jgi:hypothetical protein
MLKDGMPKAQIVAVLQGYAHDVNRIVALVPMGAGAARDAQLRLKELKTAIHGDYKHRHALTRSTDLTPAEQASLERAIREVFFALQDIGVNSNPGREWSHALFAADVDIQRCIAVLQGATQRSESATTDWF